MRVSNFIKKVFQTYVVYNVFVQYRKAKNVFQFFENGAGRIFKNVDVVKYIEDFEKYNLDDNRNAGKYQQDQYFDNEISYPYEELRDIIKKTRKLLVCSHLL